MEVQVQVELVGIVRMVSPEEFLSSCGRGSVKVRTNAFGRVVLCGPSLAVKRARGILRASPELEAGVLAELAKGDPALAALLEGREAILEADGLLDGPLDAPLGMGGRNGRRIRGWAKNAQTEPGDFGHRRVAGVLLGVPWADPRQTPGGTLGRPRADPGGTPALGRCAAICRRPSPPWPRGVIRLRPCGGKGVGFLYLPGQGEHAPL